MSNKKPNSKLKAMLASLRSKENYHVRPDGILVVKDDSDEQEYVEFEELKTFQNSHALYGDISAKIKAESNIDQVKQISLDYLHYICSEMSDSMARKVSKRILG